MPSLFEQKIHQNIIYTRNRRYSIQMNQWYFNGGEIVPRELFYALWGDFLIYQIWVAVSVSRGAIFAG